MRCRNLFAWIAIAIAMLATLSVASTVTLTGGCSSYLINSSRSYMLFNLTNSGDGGAANLVLSVAFPGIAAANSTNTIQNVGPQSKYSVKFYLSNTTDQGSYAVNVEATYLQSGSTYSTVFPCVINIGTRTQEGPLVETAHVSGKRLYVNITNTASQSIQANVTAVVPPGFTVAESERQVDIAPNGRGTVYFDVTTPSYTDASFPLSGELSYWYNGSHYAMMSSVPLVFGPSGISNGGLGGMGVVGLALIAIVVIIVALIALSIAMKARRGGKSAQPGGPDMGAQ
ncbi:MAG: hypothetical protein KGH94_02535 [Candidatus Micrarchaeota archaeon]|nr:hypothetical protein [Candidatus Micrarchaeota archaeon]